MPSLAVKLQDRPIPIRERDNVDVNFDIVQRNIEILWKRLSEQIKIQKDSAGQELATSSSDVEAHTHPHTHTGYLQNNNFFAYDKEGLITVSSSWVDVTLDTEVFDESAYSHAVDSAEVEILATDKFEIVAEVGVRNLSEGSTCELRIMLYDDATATWSEIDGTRAYCKL